MSSLQLLLANREASPANVQRAIMSLYGNIGSNLDERNWAQILASADPLLASEQALASMLRDPAYLMRNANNLLQRGYTDSQVSYTYQQLAQRVDAPYSADWALSSDFARAASLPITQLMPQVVQDHRASLPPPSLAFTGTDTGFVALLSEAGELRLSVTGVLGSYQQGSTTLTNPSNLIKRGTMTLRSSDTEKLSPVSSQYLILGRNAADTINAGAPGWRAPSNYIDAGGNDDVVDGWTGPDFILGGAGDDILDGKGGDDTLLGGGGADLIAGGPGDDSLSGGTGLDSLSGDVGADTLLVRSAVAERDIVFMDIAAGDAADTLQGFAFGVGPDADGLVLFGMTGLDLIGDPGSDSLATAIANASGEVQQAYPADTAALAGPGRATLYRIGMGADALGSGTTAANAVARAAAQLADGGAGNDFLAATTGANQGALVLMTDDGTQQFLFSVIDVDNNQTTTAADVRLIGIFVDAISPESVVMSNFSN
jgi:Ca2+-binding RTX toxin-like protein